MTTVVELRDMDVQQHPYRSATVVERFLQVPRDLMRDFEKALAKKAGVQPNNHTVYTITHKSAFAQMETTHISFSDKTVTFGRQIRMERW